MAWFVLKMRTAANAVRFRELLTEAHIYFFLPMTKQVVRKGAQNVVVEKPLLFSYIFIRTDETEAIHFVDKHDGVALLRHHVNGGQPGPYVVVPDVQMNGFICAVELYGEKIPLVSPTAAMLARGDKVRILCEPFVGVEGILEAKQGKDGGRVIIRIGDELALPTIEIEAKFIEVLQFAKQGKHLYKKLDSFEPRLRKALDLFIWDKPLTPELSDHLSVFTRRFANLNVPAANARARFLSMLMLAYALLGQQEEATQTYHLLADLKPSLNSRKSIATANDYINAYKMVVHPKR